MSEINKVYNTYGQTAGKQYLVLFYSSMVAASNYDKASDEKGFSVYKSRFDEHIKKEYGQDFFRSYCDFVKENESNQKLIKELNKYRNVFLSRTIVDLAKEPVRSSEKDEIESVPGGEPVSASKPTQTPAPAKQRTDPANRSRQGSVNIAGMKANFSYDNPDQAIPMVKASTFLQPHDADNWCVLGDLYAEKKDWKTAIAYYDKALVKNPKSTRAIAGREKAVNHLNNASSEEGTSSIGHRPQGSQESIAQDVTYYFENEQEFLIYVGLNKEKTKGKIIWGNGTQYQDECKRGFALFERKQYVQAIDVYQQALKVNPVGITARFEICAAYNQLGNLSASREMLKSIEPYVYNNQIIAKYYRVLGFILIEEEDYKTAANVYQYSLFFEEQQSAKQELLYIVNKAGFDVLDGTKDKNKVERVLTNAGIPVLKTVL